MSEGSKAGSKAVRKAVQVLKHLAAGDILGWKSVRSIADALDLTRHEVHAALVVLVEEGLVEKNGQGFRQSPQGLSFYAVQAQEAVNRAVHQCGFRK